MEKVTLRFVLLLLGMQAFVTFPNALGQESEAQGSKIWDGKTPVGRIVAEVPATARVFELVEIDYCCGGNSTLREAALESKTDLRLLLRALKVVGRQNRKDRQQDPSKLSLEELIDHIVRDYHQKLRTDLPPLMTTTATVFRVHGADHPELEEVKKTLTSLAASILPHIDEEEKETFPLILKLARGHAQSRLSSARHSRPSRSGEHLYESHAGRHRRPAGQPVRGDEGTHQGR